MLTVTNKLYGPLLKSMDLTFEPNGIIVVDGDDGERATIEVTTSSGDVVAKNLFILSDESLRDANLVSEIGYHPLSESIGRGESPVLVWTREAIETHLQDVFNLLAVKIVELNANTDAQKSLNTAQKKLLRINSGIDGKTTEALTKVLRGAKRHGIKPFQIFQGRNAKVAGEKYLRVARMDFNCFDQDDATTVMGVKVTKKAAEAILDVFEYILGDTDPEMYDTGSHSDVAPYFDSLTKLYVKVASKFNKHLKVLGYTDVCIDTSWSDEDENYSTYRKEAPALAFNDGDVPSGKQTGIVAAPISTNDSAIPTVAEAPAKVEAGADLFANSFERQTQPNQIAAEASADLFGGNVAAPNGAMGNVDWFTNANAANAMQLMQMATQMLQSGGNGMPMAGTPQQPGTPQAASAALF